MGHMVLGMQWGTDCWECKWGTGCWECNGAQGSGAGTRASRGHEFYRVVCPKSLPWDFILGLLSAGPQLLHPSYLNSSPVLQQMATRKHAQLCFPEPS